MNRILEKRERHAAEDKTAYSNYVICNRKLREGRSSSAMVTDIKDTRRKRKRANMGD
jgi:hypothetical protein